MPVVTYCSLLCGFMCQNSPLQPNNTTQEEVQAEVGGHVRLPSRHRIQGKVTFMYMQKSSSSIFVNGHYDEKHVQPDETFRNRTKVDPHRPPAWVDLWDVRVTDEGAYDCILRDEAKQTKMLTLYLKVTANYSAPAVTVSYSNESDGGRGLEVTCSSSGGYPNVRVEWIFQPQAAGAHWTETNESSVQDPITMLYTVSTSIFINCSQPLKIRCTVGGAVSQQEEVCNTSGPVPDDRMVITAAVITAILFILVMIIMVKKEKACPTIDTPDVEAGADQFELQTLT
ncbi:hypothetical protein SKAU_G00080990 [Synaphobranchus kaupii]|uniref:Ig-like domain-containing protein n=1 Tax=Synaphobranchus kaupii TaxID=118154 RepID=A0A9Q1J5H7_SYNKA|nr:hypothetical protein SKAU_G00080990 [Synaphobranchus kaupii]